LTKDASDDRETQESSNLIQLYTDVRNQAKLTISSRPRAVSYFYTGKGNNKTPAHGKLHNIFYVKRKH